MGACCPLVVIGHVDHGKTALVRALSGMETDRLDEERRRGLSIVAGYAHCTYPEGVVDLIDAPGHADFIRAMVAGAAGARAALLVVCAKDGVRAQTREHIEIVQCLGVDRFIVALARSDLVAPDQVAARCDAIISDLAALSVPGAAAILCSARTGQGLGQLHQRLTALLRETAPPSPERPAILPVDRVFAAKGHGTVVTGTLIRGGLHVQDHLTLQPAGRAVTLRAIQSRGVDRERVQPGERVALNLRALGQTVVAPGALIGAGDAVHATDKVDVVVTLLPGLPKAVNHMQDLRVHFGTAAESAKLVLYGQRRLLPGETGFGQLRFLRTVAAYAGQPALLRALSPAASLGGARFLDTDPSALRRGHQGRLAVLQNAHAGDLGGLAAALCREGGGLADEAAFIRLSGRALSDVNGTGANRVRLFGTGQFAMEDTFDTACRAFLAALDAYFAENRLKLGLPDAVLTGKLPSPALKPHVIDALLQSGVIEVTRQGLCRAGHDPERHLSAAQADRMACLETRLEQGGTKPPALDELIETACDRDLVALSLRAGRLIDLENVALRQVVTFHTRALARAVHLLRDAYPASTCFTTSEARETLATTRKFIVPMLEHFDRQGNTIREGNLRRLRK